MSVREKIYNEIITEREYQDNKWGTAFDDKNTANDWVAYLVCYLGKAVTLPWDRAIFRQMVLKVAALCFATLETLERNDGLPPRHYDN